MYQIEDENLVKVNIDKIETYNADAGYTKTTSYIEDYYKKLIKPVAK
jgi:hypothetical protein